jgi:S1-C subfamily serine protease
LSRPLVVAGFVTATLACCVVAPAPAAAADSDPLQALVEVKVLSRSPDPFFPWRRQVVNEGRGSGSLVEGKRVLTAAHVVQDSINLKLRRNGSTKWFDATVEHVCDQADLALLRVSDPAFFAGVSPLEIGPMPEVRDAVQALGFPLGGSGAAVTRGVVSRISVGRYVHSREELLLMQIDAAINGGSSGGPLIADGKLVGVALQSIGSKDAENVGYVAPPPVIEHFFRDVSDGVVNGFPRSGIWWQPLEGAAHRNALGLAEDQGGVLINHVDDGSSGTAALRPGDVILAVGGFHVADDGSIAVPGVGQTVLDYAFQMRTVGEPVALQIVRDRKKSSLTVPASYYEMLVPQRFFGAAPPYLIYGGLVLQPLTYAYFTAFEGKPPANLAAIATKPYKTADRRQAVVITTVLASESNATYRWAEDMVVTAVDGVRIRDMAHMTELLDRAAGPNVTITVEESRQLVFDVRQVRAEMTGLMEEYDAKRDRSQAMALPASPAP